MFVSVLIKKQSSTAICNLIFVHIKLRVHKAVTVGANLHSLTFHVLIDIASLCILPSVTL